MNGLFFGNTAKSGGVDPRYPKILADIIPLKYNYADYVQLEDFVSDDQTLLKKIQFTLDTKVKVSIILKKMLGFFSDDPELESDILTMTATDQEGFSTTKKILIVFFDLPDTYSGYNIFTGNGNCSFDIMTLYPDLQSNFFNDTLYLVDDSIPDIYTKYCGMKNDAINLNLKLNGTTVEIKPKISGTLTGHIYIANPTKQKLLTIEYTINN